MSFSTLNTLFNVLLFLFWFRIWNRDSRDCFFNPYLAPLDRLSGNLVHFLKPVLLSTPAHWVAIIAWAFLVVFRAAVFFGARNGNAGIWTLSHGFERGALLDSNILLFVGFSLLSFAAFVFKLWGICMLYVHSRRRGPGGRAPGALVALSRPFSGIDGALQPPVLLAVGLVLALALNTISEGPASSYGILLARGAISALAAWIQILPLIVTLVIVAIIGSWIGYMSRSPAASLMSREWLDLLLGPVRRWRLQVGMFDLSPIVFIFGVNLLHGILIALLESSYNALP